jgi:acyl-CoA thioester hydrolase
MKGDAPYRVEAQLLDHDHKRVVLFLAMSDTGRDVVAATSEQMLISIDMTGEGPRSAQFLPAQAEAIERLAMADSGKPRPEAAGKGIGIRR